MRVRVLILVLAFLSGTISSLNVFSANLFSTMDAFDNQEKEDAQALQSLIKKARICIEERDYECADNELKKANRVARGQSELKMVSSTRETLKSQQDADKRAARLKREEQKREEERQQREPECAQVCERRVEYQECVAGTRATHECYHDYARDDDAQPVDYAGEIRAQMDRNNASAARIANIHNQTIARIQNQQAARSRAQDAVSTTSQRIARAPDQIQRNQVQTGDKVIASDDSDVVPSKDVSMAKKSNSENTGRDAMRCLTITRDKEDLYFENTCSQPIFVVWCGDMKNTKRKCGDGPAGNNFYTESMNVPVGRRMKTYGVGSYKYAACEGSIGFRKKEIQDRPDGTFTCIAE